MISNDRTQTTPNKDLSQVDKMQCFPVPTEIPDVPVSLFEVKKKMVCPVLKFQCFLCSLRPRISTHNNCSVKWPFDPRISLTFSKVKYCVELSDVNTLWKLFHACMCWYAQDCCLTLEYFMQKL